ncbi:MAG: phosphoribosyltransferase family protein [Sphaerochaetaceae bacterium]
MKIFQNILGKSWGFSKITPRIYVNAYQHPYDNDLLTQTSNTRFMASATDYGELGDSKFEIGDYDGAISDYMRHLRKNPYESYYWKKLGHCYCYLSSSNEKTKAVKAIAAYEQAYVIEPDNCDFSYFKGFLFSHHFEKYDGNSEKIYDLALSAFNEALRINPNNKNAFQEKARLLLKMDKISEAVETYKAYIGCTYSEISSEDYVDVEVIAEHIDNISDDLARYFPRPNFAWYDPDSKKRIYQDKLQDTLRMFAAVLSNYFLPCDLEMLCDYIKDCRTRPGNYSQNCSLFQSTLYGEILGNMLLQSLEEDGSCLEYLTPISQYNRVVGKNAVIIAMGIVGSKYPEYGLDYNFAYKLLAELEQQYSMEKTSESMKDNIIRSMEKILHVLEDDSIEDDWYENLDQHKDEYYYLIGQHKGGLESIQYFKKAISINNTVPDYWTSLGEKLFDCYEYARAVYCFSRALDCSRDCSEYLISWFGKLGNKYCELEMYDHAYDCFEKVNEYTSVYREKMKEVKSKLRYITRAQNKFEYEEEFIVDVNRSVFRHRPTVDEGEYCALDYYYPSRDSQHEQKHTQYILKMKQRDPGDCVEFFLNQIKGILNPDVTIAVCVVPPSTPGKRTYMHQLAQRIAHEYRFIDATSCLQRMETVQKSHRGNDRSEQKHLESIEICDVEKIADRPVLLLDDVVTTGSSLAACKQILLDNGAKDVECLALGRTYR